MRMGVQLPVAKVEVYTQSGQLGFAVDSGKGGGSSFIYLAGQRIAEDHWNCANNTHTASYFHSDALGSPVATTDAARNVLERTYYAPYGEALNRSVDGPGYTGHVMDAATGLVYAQQRYYDPLVGKFLSIDPVAANPGTGGNFNRYWYANNNPYKFTDPDGRIPLLAAPVIIFVIEALTHSDPANAPGPDDEVEVPDPVDTVADALPPAKIVRLVTTGVNLGQRARDSSKNEKHGDNGRSSESAKKAAEKLREEARNLPKKERQAAEKKAQRIERDAARKRRGEEHSRTRKR